MIKNSFLYQNLELFYWQREAKNSQSEVDFVIQQGEKTIPIEVKSGEKGSVQSLFLFLEEKKCLLESGFQWKTFLPSIK